MASNTRTESAASATSRVAPLDFSALSFADVETPTRATNGGATADPALVAALKASTDGKTNRPDGAWIGKGKGVTVPRSQVGAVVAGLRLAGEALAVGVTISYWVKGVQAKPADVLGVSKSRDGSRAAQVPTVPANTNVQVRFAAKSPKRTKARTEGTASN
jgi:hypothetical protein